MLTIKPTDPTVYVRDGGCLQMECSASKTTNTSWSKVGGTIK